MPTTKPNIQAFLAACGESTAGNKPVLEERAETLLVSKLTGSDLKDVASLAGLSKSGSKAEVAKRIVADKEALLSCHEHPLLAGNSESESEPEETKHDSDTDSAPEGGDRSHNLRGALPDKDAVFASPLCGGKDIYTMRSKSQTMRDTPETDHVWEIQLVNAAWKKVDAALGPSKCTRAQKQKVAEAINGLGNLNVTTNWVNQKKKGPFTSFKNRYIDEHKRTVTLEQFIRTSALEDGIWSNINAAVVAVWDNLHDELGEDDRTASHAFVDELHEMLHKMGIDT